MLGLHYAMRWPNRELDTARPLRRSPLYDRLAAKGAVFGSKMGWERPNYFAPREGERTLGYTFGRQNWFDTVAAEQRAAREARRRLRPDLVRQVPAAGPRRRRGAAAALCANDVDVPVGRRSTPALLNARGGFESDLTVTRLGAGPLPHRHRLGAGDARRRLDRAPHPDGRARVADRRHLCLCGARASWARARASCCRGVTAPSFDNAAFPFATIREIDVGYATLRAARMTYVGELGWELYVPTEFAATVYDALRRRARSASPTPATTRSTRCGSRRATAPGAAS